MKKFYISFAVFILIFGNIFYFYYFHTYTGIAKTDGKIIVPLNHKNSRISLFESADICKDSPVASGYKDGKYKYYNYDGSFLFDSEYSLIEAKKDYSVVRKRLINDLFFFYDPDFSNKFGILDNKGNLIYKYNAKELWLESLPIEFKSSDKIIWFNSLFDCKTKSVIIKDPCYEMINPDLISVEKNKKYGVYDLNGNQIVPCIYENIVDRKIDDICIIRDRFSLYDTKGNPIIEDIEFYNVIGNNLYVIKNNKTYQIINKKPIPYKYEIDLYNPFREYYLASEHNKNFIADSNMKKYLEEINMDVINSSEWDYLQENDSFICEHSNGPGKDNLFGVIKRNAKSLSETVIPFKYIGITPIINKKYLILENQYGEQLTDLNGKPLIQGTFTKIKISKNNKYIACIAKNFENTVIYDSNLNKIMKTKLTYFSDNDEIMYDKDNYKFKIANIKERKTYTNLKEYILCKNDLSDKEKKSLKNAYIKFDNNCLLIYTNPILPINLIKTTEVFLNELF